MTLDDRLESLIQLASIEENGSMKCRDCGKLTYMAGRETPIQILHETDCLIVEIRNLVDAARDVCDNYENASEDYPAGSIDWLYCAIGEREKWGR